MDDSTAYETLTQCYLLLRGSCPTNEQIQQATTWLDSFYKEPIAIPHLINFFKNSQDPTDRQHAIIGLAKCVGLSWELVAVESKAEVFKILLGMVITEPQWTVRRNIIDIISKAVSPDYCLIILEFVRECVSKQNTAHLEIALLLSALFPQGFLESYNDPNLPSFFFEMINIAFQCQQPEVLIAAIQFILENNIIDTSPNSHPEYWECFVNSFDLVINSQLLFPRLVNLYSTALGHANEHINPIPLLEKCMNVFAQSKSNLKLILQLNIVIQAICHNYSQLIIQSGIAQTIIQTYMQYLIDQFEPEDQFVLSNAPAFEPIFTDLCTPETIQMMWEMCSQVATEFPGLFVFSRVMAATFTVAIDFYSSQMEQVVSILRAGIQSDSPLLRDSCAKAADEFVSSFVFESDELSLAFVHDIYKACQANISGELVQVLASLLDATKKTDHVFDEFFPFLVSVIQQCDVETQAAALQCISNLAKWSSYKIFVYYGQLLDILSDILGSTLDALEHLKGPAVITIAIVAVAIGSNFDDHLDTTFPFLISNLDNESLGASCITALENIMGSYVNRYYQDQYRSEFNEKILDPYMEGFLQYALDNAMLDYSSQHKLQMELDEGFDYPQQFEKSASSLRLLSDIIAISPDLYDLYGSILIKACAIQAKSIAPKCRIAVTYALINLAKGTQVDTADEITVAQAIGAIIIELASESDANVCYETFLAASQIITWISWRSLLDTVEQLINIIAKMIEDPQTQMKRPMERGRDLFNACCDFIVSLTKSAGDAMVDGEQLIMPLIPSLKFFATHNVIRFRSIALSILASLLTFSSAKIDYSLKSDALEASLATVESGQCDEGSAFLCLKALATNHSELVLPYAARLYPVFLAHLDPNRAEMVERNILMRDRCVSCFGEFFLMKIFQPDNCDMSQVIHLSLLAMPIQLDFDLVHDTMVFFLWLFERSKGNYNDQFLRVLAVEFSNHWSNIELHDYREDTLLNKLRWTAFNLFNATENAEKIVTAAVDSDETRLEFFKANLAELAQVEEEEEAIEEEA